MSITDKINDAIQQLPKSGSVPPAVLYLGKLEHSELVSLARSFTGLDYRPDGGVVEEGKRLEYRGMKVYRVDAWNHLQFGTEIPSPCS